VAQAGHPTTQQAPLERLLTSLRTKRVARFAAGKVVLDFGCGQLFRTLRALGGQARRRVGLDVAFAGKTPFKTDDGIDVVSDVGELAAMSAGKPEIDCVTSLACFEHLETADMQAVLRQLAGVTTQDAVLVGTVPTPAAKPVLEFLSYKLGLIDKSQILDHKVYYDRKMLEVALQGTGWRMVEYGRFQVGFNSFFRLVKV
jgi:hypothetical protein